MKKITWTREFYKPKSEVIEHKELENGLEYYLSGYKNSENVVVTAFGGKRQKPDIYIRYRNIAQARAAVDAWLKTQRGHAEFVKEQKEKRIQDRKNLKVAVGDIFVASWGYDQTNVDAYQVVRMVGKVSVVVKRIQTRCVPGTEGFMYQNVIPVPGAFASNAEELTRRLSAWGDNISIKIDECRTARYEKEPRQHYCSWYA